MAKRILITGGAGFIGSHLADELLLHGYDVRVLDSLVPQVHGPDAATLQRRPDYLDPRVELFVGDVRDRDVLREALQDVSGVFHFAAMVGVGQSMYQVERYTDVNACGTAVLLEELVALSPGQIERLVVASSMSIYGEGLYLDVNGNEVQGCTRHAEQMREGQWELFDRAGRPLTPVPTPERKVPELASVYALGKYDQERLCLLMGQAYNIPAVALRFFNVFGTRQALGNPYTGVLAIFASRLLNGKPPVIYEDGYQQRDFVHVSDVARGCRLALESPDAPGEVFNIGSGRSTTIRHIADTMAQVLGRPELKPQVLGKYRVGDIRHCFADLAHARQLLGYEPRVHLRQGMEELVDWLRTQQADDRSDEMRRELETRGLAV